jgi:hypothetical protein
MADVEAQVHHKFKVFTTSGPNVGDLGGQVERFVAERQVAAKSIGVEYLEGAGKLVLTLGYRDDEPGYGVSILSRSVGVVGSMGDLSGLEARMADAAGSMAGVLCHELFVTDSGEFIMVFMAKV